MKKFLLCTILCFFSLVTQASELAYQDVEFTSHNVKLSGTIVMPASGEIKAAVVFVHGSGKQSRNLHWAKQFAEADIAALVYDKRGAGKSGGEYEGNQSVSEKNINLLADDAIAALQKLKSIEKLNSLPKGLTGISQAGWIVPVAAERSQAADFMVLWSSPVCKVSEEDIFSKYTRDRDTQKIPTYQQALNARRLPYIWPDFLGKDSNPSDNLSNLNIPGLWIFGGRDGSIPVDLSVERLTQLTDKGHRYEYVLYSASGHNNMTETFPAAVEWIHRNVK